MKIIIENNGNMVLAFDEVSFYRRDEDGALEELLEPTEVEGGEVVIDHFISVGVIDTIKESIDKEDLEAIEDAVNEVIESFHSDDMDFEFDDDFGDFESAYEPVYSMEDTDEEFDDLGVDFDDFESVCDTAFGLDEIDDADDETIDDYMDVFEESY